VTRSPSRRTSSSTGSSTGVASTASPASWIVRTGMPLMVSSRSPDSSSPSDGEPSSTRWTTGTAGTSYPSSVSATATAVSWDVTIWKAPSACFDSSVSSGA
jgi:hypothetical protein